MMGRCSKMAKICERFDDLGEDGRPARLGLMGGTFDPIHIGHLRVAEEMRLALDLDAVVFIPTGNPVFKKDQQVTDAHIRLRMCKRAVWRNPHFDVSPIEVDREGLTFTVDTLRVLREHFPENVKLFFIVGSDTASTVAKWRDVAEVARLASLAVAEGRPGSAGGDELREYVLGAAPFDLHIVHVSPIKVASSELRVALQAGDPCRYLIPEPVLTFIREHNLYRGEARQFVPLGTAEAGVQLAPDYEADVSQNAPAIETSNLNEMGISEPAARGAVPAAKADACNDADADAKASEKSVLGKAFFKARKKELETRVSPKRFEHSLGVSQACEQLAKTYGLDVKKARLAGLLHDWDKGMNDEEARARVAELHMEDEVDPWVVDNMPRVLHSYTAARALARDFPQIPDDVLQAIDRHTTAAEDMSELDMALYIADAIEPSRQFGLIDELRAAVGKVSLEELYFQTYEYWTFLLFERKKTLHPDTMRIWNSNVLRRGAMKKRGESPQAAARADGNAKRD